MITAHRASLAHCLGDPTGAPDRFEYFDDGLLLVDEGRIAALGPASELLEQLSPDIQVTDHGDGVIVPSHDGGTNVIGGVGHFDYSYGPASYHRHLAVMHEPTVQVDPRLALDVDTVGQLDAARRLPGGAWLNELVP